jgi:hypothetical protein
MMPSGTNKHPSPLSVSSESDSWNDEIKYYLSNELFYHLGLLAPKTF